MSTSVRPLRVGQEYYGRPRAMLRMLLAHRWLNRVRRRIVALKNERK